MCYIKSTTSSAIALERYTMCYVVIASNGEKIMITDDWRAAVNCAHQVNGRVCTEGKFDDGRKK